MIGAVQNRTGKRVIYYSPTIEQNISVEIQMEDIALVKTQLFTVCNANTEVGGLLIGPKPVQQANGRYLTSIIDVIYAFHTKTNRAELTFTADSWAQMTAERVARFPDMVAVGWFHSHPDWGLFFSKQDISLHSGFFDLPFMVGLVLDPIRRELDFFAWNMNKEICKVGFQLPDWAKSGWQPIE